MAGYIGTKAVLLSTTAADVTGNAEIGGDLTVGGNVTLGDNDKAIFGAGSDLQIYHDGNNRLVTSGDLLVNISDGDEFQVLGSQTASLRATATGSVRLFYNGAEKLATSDTGVNVTGSFTSTGIDDNASATAMTLDASGNLLINRTVTDRAAKLRVDLASGTNGAAVYISRLGGTVSKAQIEFANDNGIVGSIKTSASTTSYNTSSDYRLKENITPVQGATDIVKAMRPCTYTFKADGDWADGFIAHELQELHPVAVSGEKDAMRDEEYEVTPAVLDEDGSVVTEAVMGTRSVPDYQGVDYSKLTPILTAALQEALNKIDALEARLTALEATP